MIGIDEAGRGPLAGPVAVGAVLVPTQFQWELVAGVKDSKQLSTQKREAVYQKMEALREQEVLRFAVAMTPPQIIDTEGIVFAVRSALMRAIEALDADPEEVQVLLDGGLRAPAKFIYQQTIIKGDTKEKAISLASIAAKVERDRLMEDIALAHPKYQFEIHKGYGTDAHRKAIRQFGLSEVHRKTFCKSLTGSL